MFFIYFLVFELFNLSFRHLVFMLELSCFVWMEDLPHGSPVFHPLLFKTKQPGARVFLFTLCEHRVVAHHLGQARGQSQDRHEVCN